MRVSNWLDYISAPRISIQTRPHPSETSGWAMRIGLGPNVNAAGVFFLSSHSSRLPLKSARDRSCQSSWQISNLRLVSRSGASEPIFSNPRQRNGGPLSVSEMRSSIFRQPTKGRRNYFTRAFHVSRGEICFSRRFCLDAATTFHRGAFYFIGLKGVKYRWQGPIYLRGASTDAWAWRNSPPLLSTSSLCLSLAVSPISFLSGLISISTCG